MTATARHRAPTSPLLGSRAPSDGHRHLRRLPGAVPHPPGQDRRLRPLRQRRRPADPRWTRCVLPARRRPGRAGRSSGQRLGRQADRSRARLFVTGIGAGTTYPDYKPAPFIVGVEARRRRHGHRRDRGHLQLLRPEGEDRHRPPPRAREAAGARRGRAGRPRHHRRVRHPDAGARRRAPPDRRQQEGRRRHLRRAAGARATSEAGRAARSTAAPR